MFKLNEEGNCEPVIEKLSVGEEFVEWAEQYWGLKRAYSQENNEGESSSYNYMRKLFGEKINELIKDKLWLY